MGMLRNATRQLKRKVTKHLACSMEESAGPAPTHSKRTTAKGPQRNVQSILEDLGLMMFSL